MTRPLNLASGPFRNETLPAVLFGLAALSLVVLTAQHAVSVTRLRPGLGTPQQQEVLTLEAEAARLRADVAAFRVPEPDPQTLPQWTLIKGLVDQRTLRWTELLSILEEALPPGVRVVSLVPEVKAGRVNLQLTVIARSPEDGLNLLPILEERPEFDSVYPISVATREDGSEHRYAMLYRPPSAGPQPQESPTNGTAGDPGSTGGASAPEGDADGPGSAGVASAEATRP